ncbi:MAG: hypothetical protein AAFR36_23590 [Bacteroidota bacterium]
MKSWLSIIFLVVISSLYANSQNDTILVDKNFQFTDGLYSDAASLRTNRPNKSFSTLAGNLILKEEDYLLKVETLFPRGRPDLPLILDDIDFVVVNGLPYVRAYQDSARQFTVYAGLRVRGKLCYFSFAQNQPDTILIKAYNPLNGRPFRQQNVVRDREQVVEKVLDLESGEIVDYNLDNLLALFAEDPALVKSLNSLSADEAEERLQRCLLIYDDRHPIYLPVAEPTTN